MDKFELKNRYLELYGQMASSSDTMQMKNFGAAEQWGFDKMVEQNQKTAERWLSKIESGFWNNFVSKAEYEEVAPRLEGKNGSRGPKWTYEQIVTAVQELGGETESKPCYNSYALALVMNMLYSDHEESAGLYVDPDDIPAFFYAMSVEKLKDRDRKRFVREFFVL